MVLDVLAIEDIPDVYLEWTRVLHRCKVGLGEAHYGKGEKLLFFVLPFLHLLILDNHELLTRHVFAFYGNVVVRGRTYEYDCLVLYRSFVVVVLDPLSVELYLLRGVVC